MCIFMYIMCIKLIVFIGVIITTLQFSTYITYIDFMNQPNKVSVYNVYIRLGIPFN